MLVMIVCINTQSRQGVCVTMLIARSVHDLHIVLAQLLNPSGYLSLWLLKVEKPRQTTMVSAYQELPTKEVMGELPCESDHSQQFLTGGTVPHLFFGESK
ncbi:hypothetical protein DPMN_089849 [Dreissena polymorpha]|uniref:Uncharacterized protein n=1 Tax=Dreissena polymorpha TaxID=45954 RepID=A0A9D4KXJ9_DREPO|nr:hypothetical protein DPMN_089849 [Dreissena polymorpha]